MSGELRVAIAVYGLAGEVFHAPLVACTDGLRVAAVTTSSDERAARARVAYPGVEVARAGRAPPLQRGIAVVVDKPPAATAAPAAALADDFAGAGVPLMVFQNRRGEGDFLTVRRIVESGRLGAITRLERLRRQVSEGAWRELPDAADGGGLLLDPGAHLIDQAPRSSPGAADEDEP